MGEGWKGGKGGDSYVPITSILKVIEVGKEGEVQGVQIHCKDFRSLTFTVMEGGSVKQTKSFLSAIANPPLPSKLFAYTNKEIILHHPHQYNGWDVYHPSVEYDRLGLTWGNGWRITNVNRDYSYCATYPSSFIVPEKIDDETLIKIAQFRSKGRVMGTVWRHPVNGATITRCSQPRVGFFLRSRSEADEKMVNEIRSLNPLSSHVYLLDSRPIANAKANSLRKGGHENPSIYTNCKLLFLSIPNIHYVFDSYIKLFEICQDHANQERWLSALEGTNWMQMISTIISAALKIVVLIDKRNASVITHCSDGWDRTSQISALSQFLLDPYYRTINGFAILIEKEWISFGHMFNKRCGHTATTTDEIAPIFLLFLDCIYQIIHQFPCSVEFNEKLLIFLADNVYSCRFGTFLTNCEKEIKQQSLRNKTISIWTKINEKKEEYLNIYYRMNSQVLSPSCSLRKLQFWNSYYLRWITSPHPKENIDAISKPAFLELHSLRKQLKAFH